MPGFFEHAGDAAERGGGFGAALGFLVGSFMFRGRTLNLKVVGKVGIVTAYFGAAGSAFGVLFEAFAYLR